MKRLLLTSFAALALAAPAYAQTDSCADDLTRVIALLEQVQTDWAENNLGQASTQLAEVQTQLEGYGDRCLTEQTENVFELTETGTFTNDFGVVTFQYPAGWSTLENNGSVMLYQDDVFRELVLNGTEPPVLSSGQVGIVVGVSVGEDMGYFEAEPEPTARLLVENLRESMPFGQESVMVDTSELKINDRDAARLTMVLETYALNALVVDMGVETNTYGPMFAVVGSLTARDEYEDSQELVEAIAATIEIEYDPEILGSSDRDGHGPGG